MKIIKENLYYFKKNILHDNNKWNNLYLLNWFTPIVKNLEKFLDYKIIELSPISHKFDIVTNFIFFLIKKIKGDFNKYKIVHINNWENFLNAKKYQWQVLIWESHWFHFGLNFSDTLIHFSWFKKIIASIVEFLISWLIRYKIKKFDIYYVSTPNMLTYAKQIRYDAKWLPNAINTAIFNPNWIKTKLQWSPVVFYPTRLHSFKNPKFWIDLFFKIKEKYPNATLHLIKYPNWWDPLASYYEKKLIDNKTYFWHSYKNPNELAEMYRWSDIVLWHFHESLWMMSLVELEATACWIAVISYDKYEIKTKLTELENITFSILSDKDKYNDFVSKNLDIVLKNHSAENIAKKLLKDIEFVKNWFVIIKLTKKKLLENIDSIIDIDINNFSSVWTRWKKEFLYDIFNKFSCSFLLYKDNIVIWYIIWYSDWKYWYINRFAICKEFAWRWLWNIILEHFSDNLKYNLNIEKIELVTHKILNIDWFYIKNWYIELSTDSDIKNFLKRKNKIKEINDYVWNKKKMNIFIKNL